MQNLPEEAPAFGRDAAKATPGPTDGQALAQAHIATAQARSVYGRTGCPGASGGGKTVCRGRIGWV